MDAQEVMENSVSSFVRNGTGEYVNYTDLVIVAIVASSSGEELDAAYVMEDVDPGQIWELYGLPHSNYYSIFNSGIDLNRNCNRMPDDVYNCTKNDEVYYVKNVYPPVQDLQPRVVMVIIVFMICFVSGICGNTSVLTLLKGIFFDRKSRHARQGDNAMIYIGALAICDFTMSLSLPPAIMDSVIGFWMFDTTTCKLHHIFGSVGRIMSTFLITAMSFDRFVAVCYPHRTTLRSRRFVLCMIALLMWIAFLLLFPMLVYSSAHEIVLHELKTMDSNNITRFRVYKCSDQMPLSIFYYFTTSIFFMGFLTPLVLIIFFNVKLIERLYVHTRVLPKSTIPLRRIVWYTIAIAAIYFLCWTPYWCTVIYAMLLSLIEGQSAQTGDFMVFFVFCVHLLPYVGSSSNWIIYGMLNTQLQNDCSSDDHMSVITMVNNNTQNLTTLDSTKNNRISRTSTAENGVVNRSVSTEWILGKVTNGTQNGSNSMHGLSSRSCDAETTMRLIAETDQTLL
ncbi:unnamed protein product, partial [Mesorhabditis spiculigera]